MTKVNHVTEWLGPTIDWSLERYHAMIERGIFDEDDRFELLFGKIVPISPIGRFHAACVSKLAELFITRLSGRYSCRQEQPITIVGSISEPEPDYVVASYKGNSYVTGHPTPEDILLVIEVSDRTLAKDQTAKQTLYAQSNIPEYWIVNLIERQIEVYTKPKDEGYQADTIYKEGASFDHPMLGEVEVDAILP